MRTLVAVAAFVAGAGLVVTIFLSAITTVVVPRGVPVRLTRAVFTTTRQLFRVRERFAHTYEQQDRSLALYAPFSLVCLPVVWLAAVLLGYTAIFWSLGTHPLRQAFITSGSSLLTLGFAAVDDLPSTVLAFSEAVIGLILLALLITYLPSMYAAFARREALVAMNAIQAGTPPSAVEMLERFHALSDLGDLEVEVWRPWAAWFVDLAESHTSLAALPFFRSPDHRRSWVTAAGVVLDAAALASSTLELRRSPPAELCIRAGFLSLRDIADFYAIAHDPDPAPDDPISISRAEFDEACAHLTAAGIVVRPDADQAWRDFAGWRVNYDRVLVGLADLVVAPPGAWSSDRRSARQ